MYICMLLFNRAPRAELRSALWEYLFLRLKLCDMLLWANLDWKMCIVSGIFGTIWKQNMFDTVLMGGFQWLIWFPIVRPQNIFIKSVVFCYFTWKHHLSHALHGLKNSINQHDKIKHKMHADTDQLHVD